MCDNEDVCTEDDDKAHGDVVQHQLKVVEWMSRYPVALVNPAQLQQEIIISSIIVVVVIIIIIIIIARKQEQNNDVE